MALVPAGREAEPPEVALALVERVAEVRLDLNRAYGVGPIRVALEQLELGTLHVHLHVVHRLRRTVLPEKRAERSRRCAAVSLGAIVGHDVVAGGAVVVVVAHLAVIDPDGALDDLAALAPYRDVAASESRVVGIELRAEHARLRIERGHVRHREPDVRAEVPDHAEAALDRLVRRQVIAMEEGVPE